MSIRGIDRLISPFFVAKITPNVLIICMNGGGVYLFFITSLGDFPKCFLNTFEKYRESL